MLKLLNNKKNFIMNNQNTIKTQFDFRCRHQIPNNIINPSEITSSTKETYPSTQKRTFIHFKKEVKAEPN